MKNLILILLLLMFSCKKNGYNKEDKLLKKDSVHEIIPEILINSNKESLKFLKSFYKEYILSFEKNSSDSIINQYCTSELIDRLNKSKLDYDPFLNAQDTDSSILKTFNFIEDFNNKGTYILSYDDVYNNSKIFITLTLVELEGEYKINDIINDGL
jgi:hypothetical protein